MRSLIKDITEKSDLAIKAGPDYRNSQLDAAALEARKQIFLKECALLLKQFGVKRIYKQRSK